MTKNEKIIYDLLLKEAGEEQLVEETNANNSTTEVCEEENYNFRPGYEMPRDFQCAGVENAGLYMRVGIDGYIRPMVGGGGGGGYEPDFATIELNDDNELAVVDYISASSVDELIDSTKVWVEDNFCLESFAVELDERLEVVEEDLTEINPIVARALLVPVATPTAPELVGIDTTKTQTRVKLGTGLYYDTSTDTLSATSGGSELIKNLTALTGTLTAEEFAKINENNYFTYNSTEKLTFLKWDTDYFYFSNDDYDLKVLRTSPYTFTLTVKTLVADVSTGSNKIIFLKKDGTTLEVNFKTLANQSIIGLGNFAIPVSINIGDLPQYEKTEYSISQGVYNFIVSNFDNISLIIDYANSGETFTAYSSQRYKQESTSRITYHFRTAKLFLDDDENFQFDIAFYERDGQYYLRYIYDSAGGGGITYFLHSVSFETFDNIHWQVNVITQSGGTYGNLNGFWYDIRKIVSITGTPNVGTTPNKIYFNGALASNDTIFVRGVDNTFTVITKNIAKVDVDPDTFQDLGVEPL